MKKITNCLSELASQMLGKRDTIDGLNWIQKKILKSRYYGKKKNKLYGNRSETDHFSITTSLTKNDNGDIISFRQMNPRSKK